MSKLFNTFTLCSLSNEGVHLKLCSLIIIKFNYLVIPGIRASILSLYKMRSKSILKK